MNKEELQVVALKNGTVIDHIPTDKLFTVVSLLGLKNSESNITIGKQLICRYMVDNSAVFQRYYLQFFFIHDFRFY